MIDSTQILALVAALFFGLALVLTQFGLRYRGPLQGAAVSIPASTLLFLAASPVLVDFSQWDWRAALIFAAVGSLYPAAVTVLTFQANRQVGPNVAGAVGNLAPVFAVAFAAIVLGAPPRLWDVGGIAIIVIGVEIGVAGAVGRSADSRCHSTGRKDWPGDLAGPIRRRPGQLCCVCDRGIERVFMARSGRTVHRGQTRYWVVCGGGRLQRIGGVDHVHGAGGRRRRRRRAAGRQLSRGDPGVQCFVAGACSA